MSLGDAFAFVALVVIPFGCAMAPVVGVELFRNHRQLRRMRRDWSADMGEKT